jgi:chromosome partitioning protein
MHQRNGVNTQGAEYLYSCKGLPMFRTVIRKTVKVDETTFAGKPLLVYSKNSTAAQDYVALVAEYLAMEVR